MAVKEWCDLKAGDVVFRKGEWVDGFGVQETHPVEFVEWVDGRIEGDLGVFTAKRGKKWSKNLRQEDVLMTWQEALEDYLILLKRASHHHTKELAQIQKHIRRTERALKKLASSTPAEEVPAGT